MPGLTAIAELPWIRSNRVASPHDWRQPNAVLHAFLVGSRPPLTVMFVPVMEIRIMRVRVNERVMSMKM